jgi:hypothetical protein
LTNPLGRFVIAQEHRPSSAFPARIGWHASVVRQPDAQRAKHAACQLRVAVPDELDRMLDFALSEPLECAQEMATDDRFGTRTQRVERGRADSRDRPS